MTSKSFAEPLTEKGNSEPLMGLAKLMGMAYSGADLTPLGTTMIDRVALNPDDANALMDLAIIMQLNFSPEIGLALQEQALRIQQLYRLEPHGQTVGIRLLAIMTPGNLMANAPLEFLLEGSDVTLEMLYLSPDMPLPSSLPEHDLLYIAVNERDEVRPLLKQLETLVKYWPRPVLNAPEKIALLTREGTCSQLRTVHGIVTPESVRIKKETLEQIGRGTLAINEILGNSDFPIIARPVGSHAGMGLAKLDDRSFIASYLHTQKSDEFYVAPFVDYRGTDGLYRKFRVALIDHRLIACHMAISEHWMVHYLNAGMTESADKRAEEARFMMDFDEDFARRHQRVFHDIAECIGLDYFMVDCAETPQGNLLIFEIDSGAVVHAMDPVDSFAYKQPQMRKVFHAFRDMLGRAIRRNRLQQ